ncbi:MAG: allophanate hydrolase [Propioniciclava sp.]
MTAADAVALFLDRLEQVDRPEVWITLRDPEELRAEAARIDAQFASRELTAAGLPAAGLPLAGLLCAVKDNIDVAELPTTAASASFSYTPEADALAVERLRAAGAIVVGKTNLDQFATGLVGTRSPYGAVRNSWDPERISGGSSSGSAVVVALGLVDFALGTDTAGSGRVPAALNGIIGLKPSIGLVPTRGVVPACRSLDCVTVFARDLSLASQVLAVMSGPDPTDPLAHPVPERASRHLTPRIGVPTADQLTRLDPGWTEAFASAVEQWRQRGAEIIEVDIKPLLEAATLLYDGAFVAERYTAVGAHIEAHRELIGQDLDPTVAGIILAGADPAAWQLFADGERRDGLWREARRVLDGIDALLTPTTTGHPTLAAVAADPVLANAKLGRYTNFCNLLDCASVALPAGTANGLPFGVMLTAPTGSDARLADLAHRFRSPELELAVFGAHMSGQPLNHQLISAGGSLVGSVTTAPEYRLYALPTTPPKPGLVRVETGGSSISGELWRLPAAGFGSFVAGLPAPMSIGTVGLGDGREVSGFLVEPIAVDPEGDITAHGSWRAYLDRIT